MRKVNQQVYLEAMAALTNRFSELNGARIYNINFAQPDAPVRLGVMWQAHDLTGPAEAAEFANRILDAAMAAENFVYNGYVVDYSGG